jgi:malic enzyme
MPDPLDPMIHHAVAKAVAKAAIHGKVTREHTK